MTPQSSVRNYISDSGIAEPAEQLRPRAKERTRTIILLAIRESNSDISNLGNADLNNRRRLGQAAPEALQ